jgi:hypothetical protein
MAIFKKGTDTSLFLVPGEGGGHLDVKSDFDWTVSRRASRDDVVPCYLWEYQPNNAQLINALYYWGYQAGKMADDLSESFRPLGESIQKEGVLSRNTTTQAINMLSNGPVGTASADPLDVYKYRYVARPTGFDYILPYLGTQRFGVGNTFTADNFAKDFPGLSKLMSSNWATAAASSNSTPSNRNARVLGKISMLGDFAQTAIQGFSDYRMNVIDTESWSSTDPDSITIEFELINTLSVTQANKNYELCYLLNYQNHPAQRNAFLAQSPCIYTLFIPNTIYMPVCHMPTFTVTNIGQNKMIDGRAVPEAYHISMNFKGILNPPSRNMLSVLDSGYNKGKIELPQLFGTKETQEVLRKPLIDAIYGNSNTINNTPVKTNIQQVPNQQTA